MYSFTCLLNVLQWNETSQVIITGSKSKTDYTPSLLAKSLLSILFLYCRGTESQ